MDDKELMNTEHEHEHEEHGHHHDHEEHEHHHHDHEHEEHGHHHDHEEHEHHHHDHCGCEDEHHHHHHEHDHEHHHDHDHEGHEHHHDHGHQYEVPGYRVFETHNHEGATICSFEKDVNEETSVLVGKMEQCIKALEQWLDETEATIGHVKGYVKEAGPITTFSTVGCGLNIENHEGGSAAIGFASIVFGPTEEELKEKVEQIFQVL
ncbi:MAG: hypothetical protein IJ106_15015 [Parasporobacterium sp.]|nr:hypothetical protein [Parasporobacterium sp.]